MTKVILLIFLASICNSAGHTLYKKSVNQLDMPHLKSLDSYLSFVKNLALMPAVWLGFVFVIINVVIWLAALAETDLSIAYPIGSMQYLMLLVFSRIFLGEKIDMMKLIGTLFVTAGIVLVAIS